MAEMEKPTPKWDWVTARSQCAPTAHFASLQSSARANVDTRNALEESQVKDRFKMNVRGNSFTVWDGWAHSRRAVDVALNADGTIEFAFTSLASEVMQAQVVLTDDGECKYRVGNTPLDEWQVLRRALEELFFVEP
jgi:hypothetical protein